MRQHDADRKIASWKDRVTHTYVVPEGEQDAKVARAVTYCVSWKTEAFLWNGGATTYGEVHTYYIHLVLWKNGS